MTLPDVVYLDQLREGLAFLGIPLETLSEITITPDAVTLVQVAEFSGRIGAFLLGDDGKLAPVTHEIPLRNVREVAA